MSQKELTYKSKDTEEFLDKIFYRPAGYLVAVVSSKFKITPNVLTVLCIIIGVISSIFFLNTNFSLNLTGILLLVISDIFDSADGQLARLINKTSKFGRILDGLGGNIIFLSIYIVFCIRLLNDGFGAGVFAIALISAASHSLQSSLADYYRNVYIFYKSDLNKSELESAKDVKKNYQIYSWKSSFGRKLILFLYLYYTCEQEMLAKSFINFNKFIQSRFSPIPDYLRRDFTKNFKPMIKYYNFLTVNSRIIAISVFVLLNKPLYYFLFEIILMNAMMIYVMILHKNKFEMLLSNLNLKSENA